jgi:hypothetical protein
MLRSVAIPILVVVFVGLWHIWRKRTGRLRPLAPGDVVGFDDQRVWRRMADGREESIRWSELAEVDIVTTDEGPAMDDVFWLLLSADHKTGCGVPSEAEGMPALLTRLQELPGFDNEAVIRAMGTAVNVRLCVWKRP